MLRWNYLLKHVIEGKLEEGIEVTGRRGSRRKELLDDLKERRGYWKFEAVALVRIVWGTFFGRGCGSIVRMNENHFGGTFNIFAQLTAKSNSTTTTTHTMNCCVSTAKWLQDSARK